MNLINNTCRSNGKLLLTGEYLVMEGALSLALPINKGQTLSINENTSKIINWQANTANGNWFNAELDLNDFRILNTDDRILAQRLSEVLIAVRGLSSNFLAENTGYDVVTHIDFNPEFGFGTSSTLISNIASWANVDPYKLLADTFGGSGYDIACARNNHPIFFQRIDEEIQVSEANFKPDFHENLYFVYLGKKQNSADSISKFKANCKYSSPDIDSISQITKEVSLTNTLIEFEELLMEHESIMSNILNQKTAKSLYFNDYYGAVKSLGAWGGDFVLVTSHDPEETFKKNIEDLGFNTYFRFANLVL